MTSGPATAVECSVSGLEKHLGGAGGAAAVCDAIQTAFANAPSQGSVKIEIVVNSEWSLTARIERNGNRLPNQDLSVSDTKLSKGSIERFARAIADATAHAG
jgi:hypothetical protein